MRGASPFGGTENNLLVTVPQRDGIFYIAFAAPAQDWPALERAASTMLQTLRVAP
jgi:hypothetical protein